uniref:Antitoxin YefM n=1 Tax=Candidatus Kentrum sp. FW TaxID=2126338 RepID=A0A450TXS8_9GAMM|nr:MAG: antitoxin YefM [Candidatus Kentron sp. FW]
MYTTYRLNTDELTPGFLDALETLFKHRAIEISVRDVEETQQDETTYLLGNPANRARLLKAVENVANKQNLVSVDSDDITHENRL